MLQYLHLNLDFEFDLSTDNYRLWAVSCYAQNYVIIVVQSFSSFLYEKKTCHNHNDTIVYLPPHNGWCTDLWGAVDENG